MRTLFLLTAVFYFQNIVIADNAEETLKTFNPVKITFRNAVKETEFFLEHTPKEYILDLNQEISRKAFKILGGTRVGEHHATRLPFIASPTRILVDGVEVEGLFLTNRMAFYRKGQLVWVRHWTDVGRGFLTRELKKEFQNQLTDGQLLDRAEFMKPGTIFGGLSVVPIKTFQGEIEYYSDGTLVYQTKKNETVGQWIEGFDPKNPSKTQPVDWLKN